MLDNMFNGIMGKIAPGCCRLSMNGKIAIKTSDGYKAYDPKTGNLTNCANFVLDLADDLFMVMPTRKLKPGDIVLINGKPVYVLEIKSKNRVEVMSYEDSSIKTVIPERHAFLGRKFYGKIVSLMGNGFNGKGGFFKNMLKFKMMSSMFGGGNSSDSMFGGNNMAMMMLMGNGGMDRLFNGICDDDDEDDSEDDNVFQNLMNDDDECEDVPVEIEEEFNAPDGKTHAKTGKKSAKKTSKKAVNH